MASPTPPTSSRTGVYETRDGARIGYTVHSSAAAAASASSSSSSASSSPSPLPLVLIMGMSGVQEDWEPLAQHLATSRTVLTFDHRGIGQSYVPKDWDMDLSLDLMARDCLSLVASLGPTFRRVDVLGWSMGGHILQAALTLDDNVEDDAGKGGGVRTAEGVSIRSVVLAATMTKLPRAEFKPDSLAPIAAKYRDRDERNRALTRALLEYQYYPEWLAASASNREVLERRLAVSLSTRRPRDVIGLQISAIAALDVRPRLERVPSSLRVLSLHGRRDRMVSSSERDEILRALPHAEVLPLGEEDEARGEAVGHFFFDFRGGAAWWAESIARWLDGEGARPAAAKL